MERAAIQPDKIQVSRVTVFKSNIEASTSFLNGRATPVSHKFSFSQETGLDLEQSLIGIRLYVLLDGQDENDELLELKGRFGIEFEFEVENLRDFVEVKNSGEIILDAVFAATIMGIAYSTARGIVFQKTEGTILSGVILPILDPASLLKKDTKV
ncbi:hypothetical protein [Microscilla marina]|uniref:Preprotein translocase subunit SecB n=1 Tax=Microscilla marina ATCC 23134 TaxID=313606 RepID=A2A0F7_MICM2|nr:hypothetical protein [Microscilla marina]EAY23884.1 hypothetical protein M23134_00944 [Microscilla marina ATCC 23134]